VIYSNRSASRHAVKVVGLVAHSHNLRDDGLSRPVDTEDLSQLLQVLGSGLADRVDGVSQPAHTEVAELLVKELNTKLLGEKRNVLNDGQSDTPLLVFRELDDRGEKGLRKKLDSDDY
jgi:hypothetical protein